MKRMSCAVAAVLALTAAGCGGSSAPAAGDPSKKITWEVFRKMPAEEQSDPYVLNNLDDDARRKLAEAGKKRGR
ncbi:hypothetical protein [Urbifossiella limnaea]|uniref:Lipoprotein n=1 Tax=Urbifossiella limnaea TaxID=2528023 RepID=A0A517XSC2_9BACT|nr:hypothetical protein [Urbifossiella limnaea]QDU20407.1 hypothetical protein ETAA1_23590 [Urbifossiella limnaea]